MCEFVKGPSVMPGWGCCRCRVYNGMQRTICKSCGLEPHEPLIITGDCATGTYHEDGDTQVEILSVDRDEAGFGITFRSLGGDIPAGEEWRSWSAHGVSPYLCWHVE